MVSIPRKRDLSLPRAADRILRHRKCSGQKIGANDDVDKATVLERDITTVTAERYFRRARNDRELNNAERDTRAR
jgi:hypothetical protein